MNNVLFEQAGNRSLAGHESADDRHFVSLADWGDQVSRTLVNLDFASEASHYDGDLRCLAFRDVVACQLRGKPHKTTRSMRRLREVESDFVLLLYIASGSAVVSHGSYEGRIEAGSFFLLDGSKPHLLEMEEDFEHYAFRSSRARMISMHSSVPALIGQPIQMQAGDKSVASTILGSVFAAPGVSEYATFTAFEACTKLLVEHLERSSESGDSAIRLERQSIMLGRIIRSLNAKCANASYSANDLAADIGISRRYLDRLISNLDTTFGRLLLEKRLERCREQLHSSKFRGRSITEIAFDNGFNDLSHFCRSFRTRYGYSARSFRQSKGTSPTPIERARID